MKSLGIQPLVHGGSLSRQVSQQLEGIIARQEIPVGDKLPPEGALCDMFSVSRTVIREAITHLKSQGLVETRRGIGTRVLRSSPESRSPEKKIRLSTIEDILNILELRLTIEPEVAALAATRHDEQDQQRLITLHEAFLEACKNTTQARDEDLAFHAAIAQATHNPAFVTIYEQWDVGAIPRAKLMSVAIDSQTTVQYLEKVGQEHADILEAILARDAKAANAAMYQHLKRAYKTYYSYK
ncbi:FadR/GntR family transcriptional regulator [Vreelandella malpeensis]|uniref:FadR family transcriptional regulator n=1 Tax=Vreelandella malpeensis TaxID=1172368 RepID=A0ABS8DNF2_9GAMM|nr:FadR/GntR family transcriptional regulator [Halomonas malpeensis]MCB8887837.1 FadR family transcriptional regulator [Halomonas malpeensis]